MTGMRDYFASSSRGKRSKMVGAIESASSLAVIEYDSAASYVSAAARLTAVMILGSHLMSDIKGIDSKSPFEVLLYRPTVA